ncbi:hypothetical protein DY000_02037930 [Brassica cretica]|uniref:Uncharacterized protein n=1 Tax=Brassica cretica TaxID=69181 RepID=A0ABQ7B9W2_BRACR|nr:hypothetical protein DY000_02037930 [Brassica cretica]
MPRDELLTGVFPVSLIDVPRSYLFNRLSFCSLNSSLPLLLACRFIFGLLLIIKDDRISSRKIDSGWIDCRRFVFSGNLDPVGDLIAVKVPLCAVLHRLSSVDGGVPSSLFLYRRWNVASPLLDACLKTPGVVTRGGMSKRLPQRDLSWALGPCGLLSFSPLDGHLVF